MCFDYENWPHKFSIFVYVFVVVKMFSASNDIEEPRAWCVQLEERGEIILRTNADVVPGVISMQIREEIKRLEALKSRGRSNSDVAMAWLNHQSKF